MPELAPGMHTLATPFGAVRACVVAPRAGRHTVVMQSTAITNELAMDSALRILLPLLLLIPVQAFLIVRIVRTVLASAFALSMASASATPFTITGTTTTGQTLGSGSGQTGSVATGASLTVAGGTVAVAITGSNATLNNLGTIAQTGSGRAIRDNTGEIGRASCRERV